MYGGKSIELACSGRENYHFFALFYFVFEGKFQLQAPAGLIFGGVIKRRVFCITILGGLCMEGLILGILRYPIPTDSLRMIESYFQFSTEVQIMIIWLTV